MVARPTDQTLTLLLLLLMPGNATVEEVSVSGVARAPCPAVGRGPPAGEGRAATGRHAAPPSLTAATERWVERGEGGCMGSGLRVAPVLPSRSPIPTPTPLAGSATNSVTLMIIPSQ